jgi:anti-anti-sigma factor
MSSNLNVVTRTEPAAAVIELHGDVSAEGQGPITSAYDDVVAAGATTVLFNLSATKYINTSGISVLIAIVMGAKKAGISVLVAGASPHYKKVFDLVRFSSFVSMFDDEATALASLAS